MQRQGAPGGPCLAVGNGYSPHQLHLKCRGGFGCKSPRGRARGKEMNGGSSGEARGKSSGEGGKGAGGAGGRGRRLVGPKCVDLANTEREPLSFRQTDSPGIEAIEEFSQAPGVLVLLQSCINLPREELLEALDNRAIKDVKVSEIFNVALDGSEGGWDEVRTPGRRWLI